MLGLAAVPAFIQFIGFLFMPESPRWLMKQGQEEKALKALRSMRSNDVLATSELKQIRNACALEEVHKQENLEASLVKQVFQRKSLRKALMIGCALQIVAQLSGINTVMYYSASIIQMAGFYDENLVLWLAAGVASVNFFCTFLGFYLVEKTGRRKLTLLSLGGVIISLLVLAAGFYLTDVQSPAIKRPANLTDICSQQSSCNTCISLEECGFCFQDIKPWTNGTCLPVRHNDFKGSQRGSCINGTQLSQKLIWSTDSCPSNYAIVTVLGLCLYLFFFAPGMGPMPWTINAEIYPLWARGFCFSVATSFNWICNLLVSLTFLTIAKHITEQGAFSLYAAFAAIGWLYFSLNLPETRGVSLEEVEHLFAEKRKGKSKESHPGPSTSSQFGAI